MELVKCTAEEQAKIDADKARPHCAMVMFAFLNKLDVFQDHLAALLERGMIALKDRADAAHMIILSTSISTNTVDVEGVPFLSVMILCQWAEIEKLEEQQRRAILAQSVGPLGRRGA